MVNEYDKKEQLLDYLQEALRQDEMLREKYQIGNKFKFIRDRLKALYKHQEEQLAELKKKQEEKGKIIAEDEVPVYVYLFNAQGLTFKTWRKFLNPSVFYEYSVNRPIYNDLKTVDTFIKNKKNPAQHAYLTIVIKRSDLQLKETLKDALGNSLVRVREGSLKFTNVLSFHHNGHDYELDAEGELIKK